MKPKNIKVISPMKRLIYGILILFLTNTNGYGQNIISVPFPNGFIGNSTGNNSANSCYYLTGAQGVGWSEVQFTQANNGNVFTAQGNDIVGEVLITDNLGVTFQIPGFIKWRTPSGNNPHTMVFQPAPGTYTLATNGFNGNSSYTIDENKYIGLTKLGSTLSISPVPGTVTGNSSTSGLLDALNEILGDLPQLDITGTTVLESDGNAEVTVDLSATSANTISVNFYTYSASALTVGDFDSTAIALSFLPGETQKLVNIPITVDGTSESDEFFWVRLFESTNAAIITSQDSVVITESTLPVTFLGLHVDYEINGYLLKWSTASEHNSDRFEIERSVDGINWINVGSHRAQGFSNQITEYAFNDVRDCSQFVTYYRIKQFDLNNQFEYTPTLSATCDEQQAFVSLYPNPAKEKVYLSIYLNRNDKINFTINDLTGATIDYQERNGQKGHNVFEIDLHHLQSSYYLILIKTSSQAFTDRLHVTH